MKSLFESHVNLLGKVMDMQLQRQNVVMSNVANIKTPGYKPRRLEFEEELQAELKLNLKGKLARTDERHMPGGFDPDGFSPEWEKAFKPRVVFGEDRVDIDKEMAAMAKTSLHYTALSTVLKSNFDGLRGIIQEGQK